MQMSAATAAAAAAVGSDAPAMAVQRSHAQRILSCLNQQRASGMFCDAALNVNGSMLFSAHRNILACFSELFQKPTVPVSPSTEISLQECPSDGLELLLTFIYTGKLKLDPDNLDKVKHAASSLCVPEALALCRQFTETLENPPPVKRKRGRPRKSTTTPQCLIKEENILTDTKEGFSSDANSAGGKEALTSNLTTTTRSGRVVKGPRRLVTDDSPPDDFVDSDMSRKKVTRIPEEKESRCNMDHQNANHPICGTGTADLEIDESVRQESEVAEADDGVVGYEPISEDSDEDYRPASSASSMSAARRRKATSEVMKSENGEAAEEEAAKDSSQCPVCDKSFKSKYYLKVHNRRHTGEKPFVCLKCGRRYFRKQNLLMHEMRDCDKVQTFTCPTCFLTFDGKESLRVHVVSHTGEMPYKCLLCPEQFMLKKNQTLHMVKIHGYPKPHACPQCPKTFLTRIELRVHDAAKHRGEKPFVCEECGHRVSSRNGLQIHIKAIHRNEKPFICPFCAHAFSQKNNLNMHLRIHSGEKPYQCDLCGKTFRTQASLDKHHRTHTGERPFSCDVCEQRFTEKGALVRHKASKHEEGRPHSCHVCGKTFKAKDQLQVHLRRHKGMRKFECSDCGYKFTRQAHLRRHVQIHKRTENYNPRQRKLRNVVVQDAERGSDRENEPFEAKATDPQEGYAQDPSDDGESVNHEDQPSPPGHDPGCIMGVELGQSGEVMEVVVSDQLMGRGEASKLVTEAYPSTVDMAAIAEHVTDQNTEMM